MLQWDSVALIWEEERKALAEDHHTRSPDQPQPPLGQAASQSVAGEIKNEEYRAEIGQAKSEDN